MNHQFRARLRPWRVRCGSSLLALSFTSRRAGTVDRRSSSTTPIASGCWPAALAKVVERFGWLCHGYCLMGNHYHLMIETPQPNLSQGMRQLGTLYAQNFNRRHGRPGHVFQGRFKAILVERESHWLEVCRYVVLNPVRAGLVRAPEGYVWSSYRATAGLAARPPWLWTDWVLGQFGRRRRDAATRYREFVREGLGGASPWSQLHGQMMLGTDHFAHSMQRHLSGKADLSEVPKRQRFAHRPSLAALFATATGARQRDKAIRGAHIEHGYTLIEIGRHLGLHYTTISKAVARTIE